jgi:hypothetical protein
LQGFEGELERLLNHAGKGAQPEMNFLDGAALGYAFGYIDDAGGYSDFVHIHKGPQMNADKKTVFESAFIGVHRRLSSFLRSQLIGHQPHRLQIPQRLFRLLFIYFTDSEAYVDEHIVSRLRFRDETEKRLARDAAELYFSNAHTADLFRFHNLSRNC